MYAVCVGCGATTRLALPAALHVTVRAGLTWQLVRTRIVWCMPRLHAVAVVRPWRLRHLARFTRHAFCSARSVHERARLARVFARAQGIRRVAHRCAVAPSVGGVVGEGPGRLGWHPQARRLTKTKHTVCLCC